MGSQVIFRQDVDFGRNLIEVPDGSKVVSFGLSGTGRPSVYWTQPSDAPAAKTIEVHLVGTGHPLPDGEIEYVGSINDGPLVWHLVEVIS